MCAFYQPIRIYGKAYVVDKVETGRMIGGDCVANDVAVSFKDTFRQLFVPDLVRNKRLMQFVSVGGLSPETRV
jgi:hypothetical protein